MKTIQLIHKEPNSECFEILKSTIIEDKVLKTWRIDKDTLIQNLPEEVVNQFLDFLGTDEQHRSLMLYMIKEGTLVVHCWEDEEDIEGLLALPKNQKIKKPLVKKKQIYDDTFDKPPSSEMPF